MIVALLTALWALGALAVFSGLVWPLRRGIPLARWAIVIVGALGWPVVLAAAVLLAFMWVITDDGRNDLED